jgi:hypothetical protein
LAIVAVIYLLGSIAMLNEEGNTELSKSVANIYRATLYGVDIVIVTAAVIFFAALAPGAIALIVLGAAALLLILGTVAFRALTCAIQAHYAANPAGAAAAYGFPTYAALKASWPWAVRLVAC